MQSILSNQTSLVLDRFLNLIPRTIDTARKISKSDFTRSRKLPFPKLITFILSLVASGKSSGVDTKSGAFFKNARRSGLWLDAQAVHRSSLTKARSKVPWQVFEDLLHETVGIAKDLLPQRSQYLWHGMSVYATDGSKYNLPATEEIRKEFDPKSGLQHIGRGHYPQCLVSTLYDVFRRIPIARTISEYTGSEREDVKSLLPFVPSGSVWLFDRGYPSYELILYLLKHFQGYFIFRAPASNTFPMVKAFIRGKKKRILSGLIPLIITKNRLVLKSVKLSNLFRLESFD